jgi:hypothetical protein
MSRVAWIEKHNQAALVWPETLDPRTVCLTVDVEWAAAPVLADLQRLFDEHGLRATFFCTHPGIDVGPHERGLHPNYRRNGDTLKLLRSKRRDASEPLDEPEIYNHVLRSSLRFAPEAKGVRSHSLYYDSMLIPIYRQLGLQYDSTYQIPLVSDLRPFWKEYEILELPIYFADHFELKTGACGFDVTRLGLDRPGLKVINLHPNMVFLNCKSDAHYLSTRSFYHDPDRLMAVRHAGRGIRTLVVDLLEHIIRQGLPTATLGEVNARWRGAGEYPQTEGWDTSPTSSPTEAPTSG